jgi:hypothetical protein
MLPSGFEYGGSLTAEAEVSSSLGSEGAIGREGAISGPIDAQALVPGTRFNVFRSSPH